MMYENYADQEQARRRAIDLCLISYQGAIEACDDLSYANELYEQLDAEAQAEVQHALCLEFPEEI